MTSEIGVAKLVFSASLSFCAFILVFLALMVNLYTIAKQQAYGDKVLKRYWRSVYVTTFLLFLGVLSWFSSFLFLLKGGHVVYSLMLISLVFTMGGIVFVAIAFVWRMK